MSKLTELFRTVRVFNEYEFYGTVPYISYTPNGNARAGEYAHWGIRKRDVDLDPGRYRSYGSKQFSLTYTHSEDERHARRGKHGELKAAALIEAQDWYVEKFGATVWAKDPFGGYGPKDFVEARISELRTMAAQLDGAACS